MEDNMTSKEEFVNWLYVDQNGELPDRATFSRYLDNFITNVKQQ